MTENKEPERSIVEELSWINCDIPGLRDCDGTYDTYNDIPPLANPVECDLNEVESPTACYVIEGKEYASTYQVGDITMSSYYNDQQDCVSWFRGSDGRVYYNYDGGYRFHLCARSKAEFDTRIQIEANLWFKLSHSSGSRQDITNLKDRLTPQEWLYVEYYLAKQEAAELLAAEKAAAAAELKAAESAAVVSST
ncbi:hypothetical protein SAMD00019534_093660 [Acytostelium subglobosum LB1]|uniref:hypothetical protein n=1 Tax=Acytostelium subglobosum LB1 TaxID=1410327 RepID=UPI0006448E5D|nr:hypothetical protein SAMD00019534_093660 [Acytostelium subglobosum LB1]GAM26191.1 hypothetical protein SAMD00019534_093660 [Acytostelium subglobosum LB1]|eukprot:XP_012750745.1 hypothetical protein SAMD00019534_093660 [Acytostelium subglobosum LB1]